MSSSSLTLTSDPHHPHQDYDRLKEVKQFDDSKLGVKGLLDSGLASSASIPLIFHHPPDSQPGPIPHTRPTHTHHSIPIVDFSAPKPVLTDQITRAASTVGFFQITNHGIPLHVIQRTLAAVKSFNELPAEIKTAHYHREMGRGVTFSTNVDLYQSKAASWRDTLQMRVSPVLPNPSDIPEVVREELLEWNKEGLGVEEGRLKEMTCLEGRTMVAHYYPYCPRPDLTYGLTSHTDPGVVTVLVQNEVVGLQVKVGEEWVDVEPVEGAVVINIGDILQIISNDEYKSVEHRVLANPLQEPRVSVAVFCNPSNRDGLFGPLPELVSQEKPARYRQFTLSDYMQRFFKKELDGKTLTNYYRL
ncbi:hypothetical protein C3L33_17209, partial [Rhododendron williamsianum]